MLMSSRRIELSAGMRFVEPPGLGIAPRLKLTILAEGGVQAPVGAIAPINRDQDELPGTFRPSVSAAEPPGSALIRSWSVADWMQLPVPSENRCANGRLPSGASKY